jgi:diguanylate cyclase (GGDEF)-like protein
VLDYNSLLIALSFCSAGLAFTFFVSWFVSRSDSVLMTWGIGVACLFVSLLFYRDFVVHFSPVGGVLAFSGLLIGLTLFMGAGRQFRSRVLPMRMMLLIAAASIAAMAMPMLLGYDGISYVILNIAAAAIMFATGLDYWRWREESPTLILLLSVMYVLTALSFVLCAVVLLYHGEWVMNRAPDGWAENINMAMCLTSIGSMGALSLGLNQVRQTRHHQREAETDSLTGLFNRRALFDRGQRFSVPVAIVIFDLDHFKRINDVHGHQVGDTVLHMFGSLLAANVRDGDLAARLGGEEFAIVLSSASAEEAMQVAERIRESFAAQQFISASGNFSCTLSAGISCCEKDEPDIVALLRQADMALYDAKRSGRNRVLLYSEETSLAPSEKSWTVAGPASESVVKLRQ